MLIGNSLAKRIIPMTQARRTLVSLADTPYYHCMTRCVRRALLCGRDPVTSRNFDHRKVWLVERFKYLAGIFAIDICAYALMSNHYHLVLYVDQHRVDLWSDDEVLERWGKLFSVSAENLKSLLAGGQSPAVQAAFKKQISQWRSNLKDLSWFMKCLNEYIARRCNKEDNCKGHFWEARFTSQALLDEKALLTCMAYVDLNPVRAAMAETPETSDFTSIQERLFRHAKSISKSRRTKQQKRLIAHYHAYYGKRCARQEKGRNGPEYSELKPFGGSSRIPPHMALPFTLQDYFQLVDYTGRVVRKDKRGSIPEHLPDILARMGFEEKTWLASVQAFMQHYGAVAGNLQSLREYESRSHLKGIKGIGAAHSMCGIAA